MIRNTFSDRDVIPGSTKYGRADYKTKEQVAVSHIQRAIVVMRAEYE